MSSSTATISSKTSSMNTNDRKRPISSSIRPSSSPPLAKRNGLSTTSNQAQRRSERPSRSKQQHRNIENQSSSSESSRSSSTCNQDADIKNSNEIFFTTRSNSDPIYTKKSPSIAFIVKSTSTTDQKISRTNYDNEDDSKQPKTNSNKILSKTNSMVISSSVSKKDNVIIQQIDNNFQTDSSTKLVKLVVPQSISSIKMVSNGDGLASALRVPTKIQLTKTLFVSSTKTDTISSTINTDQTRILPLISTNNFDDLTDKQTIVDYHSSTTLPPTPPPPVIDNRNSNIQEHDEEDDDEDNENHHHEQVHEENSHENLTNNISINDSLNIEQQTKSIAKIPTHLSDWSVPPTSELSPRSLTSSSPDLTQQHLPFDESLVDIDSNISFRSIQRRYRSLSLNFERKSNRFNKSKSLTNLSNPFNESKRLGISSILILSSSQRIKKRRLNNEQKTNRKFLKLNFDDHFIIKTLLNDLIEQIVSTNNEKENSLKTILIKPVHHTQQKLAIDFIPNRKTSNSKKLPDLIEHHESRPMLITEKKLDELAYLLHANSQRADHERSDNPAKVEERMRELWSQMSNQKKNNYYKRVIQIYKRPNRDVIITSSPTDTNPFISMDSIDNSTSISSNDFKRQTSTPLSFHSVTSTTSDESSSQQQTIFIDIVNELIQGANGLDKLSCSLTTFSNSIQHFVQSSIEQQQQMLINLEQQVEKKCSTQLNRASLFWKQKIQYFATKHQINSSDQFMNELILIVKYFYLFVLSLNCQKQQADFDLLVKDLINGNERLFDESYQSSILTTIIDDIILRSSLANEYLASQYLTINQIEYSLPFIKNFDLEYDLLTKYENCLSTNPFVDINDLEDYLNRCEHMTSSNIPSYPSHHSSMYYSSYHPSSYYYPSTDMNNYYYNTYSYSYNSPSTNYYNHSNEQYKYYYHHPPPPQTQLTYSYSSQTNSTNDIPVSQRTYRTINSNLQRTYSNSQIPTTPTAPPSSIQSPSSTSAIEI